MAPTSVGGSARRRVAALALAFLIAAAAAQPAPESASPGSLPPPMATPDLAPRALEAEELDPGTLARMALRFQLDRLALEALGATRAPALVLGVALQGQTIFLEAYGSRTPGGRPASLDDPLWLGAIGHTLTAVAELSTGAAPEDEDAYRALVFEPLGMRHASATVGADEAYDAATLPPHGLRGGVLEPLTETTIPAAVDASDPVLDRVRASARDVMALAEALTDPEPPAALAGGVREALLADVVRDHPALPGRTPGFAASVLAGQPVLRRDGDPPGARGSLVVLPEYALAAFVYLNAEAPPAGDPLIAASGARDAPGALLEAILLALLGDPRDPAAPERPWPAVSAATNPPAPGDYRVAHYPAASPNRALAALQPTFALRAVDGAAGGAVRLTPPAAVGEPIDFAPARDGVWRSARDGAPLVSSRDGPGAPRLLLHLGSTLTLERVAPLERRDVGLASWAAGIAAAIVVLVSWPLGAWLRWRRREPREWDRSAQGTLGRALRHLRLHSRINAALSLGLAAGVATLAATGTQGATPPLADALPWLHAVAVPLALLLAITLLRTLLAALTHPRAGWRWAWHALANLAFATAWLQGWVWQLWSPAAIAARWLG
ncbi:MAG: hypothetical protein K0A98_05705 [Trueperaceae bacterium]|nr:hypothetical protein [Trueperaceae bacterium]